MKQFGDGDFVAGYGLAVLSAARGARVASGEKAGSAGRADGTLREGVFKEDTLFGEAVQVGGVYIGVAITAEGVKALLVSADPEDVGFVGHEDLVLYNEYHRQLRADSQSNAFFSATGVIEIEFFIVKYGKGVAHISLFPFPLRC